MERHFDEELQQVKEDLLKMAGLAEEAILRATKALKERDKDLARSVIEGDSAIDALELDIESRIIDLLALRQPMAEDLRFVTTGMKINAELERIADLAVNIAQRVIMISDQPLLKPLVDTPKLSDTAQKMVRASIDAFVNSDEKLAREVIRMDSEADRLRNMINDELVRDFMMKEAATVPRAVALMLIARNLERICDHATNIAEDVIYMANAEVVRHHPERLSDK